MSKIDTKLPELYKKYDCYDDGKITESRKYQVLITDIIPFDKADKDLKNQYKQFLIDWDFVHLYAKETDYFIFAVSYEQWLPQVEIFVRTLDGGWFGMGEWNKYDNTFDCTWCSGRLIIPE